MIASGAGSGAPRGLDLGLDGAVVLVTGGASGIGAAVGRAAALHGAIPVLADVDVAAALAAAQDVGCGAVGVGLDVTDERSVQAGVARTAALHGRIDVVVACAGVSGPVGTPLERTSLDEWRHVLDVNVTGAFLLLRHALPWLRASARGAAVLVSSDSAIVGVPGMVPYAVSKAALSHLALALSTETAGSVRIAAICPSIVDTPMSRGDLGDDAFDAPAHPVHRAEDVAAQVLFLASPRAVGIHGTALVTDFGASARSSLPA